MPRIHRHSFLTLGALLTLVSGCGGPPADTRPSEMEQNSATRTADNRSWRPLLDVDLTHWRGYRREDVPGGWSMENGILSFTPDADRGDLVSREEFGNFELRLEWRISEGGNSGVMYRVDEAGELPWHTGPEFQVLDDERHPDARLGIDRNRTAGALYDIVGPPPGVVRPAGEWNEARILANGSHLEHWLNGRMVVQIDLGSDDWSRHLAASKFRDLTGYATATSGHVVLQDHGDPVWYRNIEIRSLD